MEQAPKPISEFQKKSKNISLISDKNENYTISIQTELNSEINI